MPNLQRKCYVSDATCYWNSENLPTTRKIKEENETKRAKRNKRRVKTPRRRRFAPLAQVALIVFVFGLFSEFCMLYAICQKLRCNKWPLSSTVYTIISWGYHNHLASPRCWKSLRQSLCGSSTFLPMWDRLRWTRVGNL